MGRIALHVCIIAILVLSTSVKLQKGQSCSMISTSSSYSAISVLRRLMLSSYQSKRRSIGGLSCLRCPVTTTTTGQTVQPDSLLHPARSSPFLVPPFCPPPSFQSHTWYSCHCRSVCLDRRPHPPVAIPRSPLSHIPHAITTINTTNSHGTWPSRNVN